MGCRRSVAAGLGKEGGEGRGRLFRAESPAPWLHIAEEVAVVAAKNHFLRLGILGTRYLMEGPVYPAKCRKWDMSCEIPDVPDRTRINSIIFDELVLGELKEDSRKYFQTVIEKLRMRGCDAVVLGCTEIPLLISESDSSLPVIESTRTLALAALREAMVSTAASQA
jgi:aspartate racemase